MNSARPQSSRQRIRDTGKTSGDAVVLIAVAVESISIDESTSGNTNDHDDDGLAYVRAICDFRRLVLADHDRVLSDVVRSLTDAYGCRSVRAVTGRSRPQRSVAADLDAFEDSDDRPSDSGYDDDAGSILLELRQPRDRMVSLQVDLSSGHLGRELQRRLVTKNLTERLGLTELTLTTEIKSIE